MKKIVLAFVITAMATPALAQPAMGGGGPSLMPNLAGESKKLKTDQDIKKEQESEAGYKAGMSRIPDAKPTKNDPWGGVRNTTATASGVKSNSK